MPNIAEAAAKPRIARRSKTQLAEELAEREHRRRLAKLKDEMARIKEQREALEDDRARLAAEKVVVRDRRDRYVRCLRSSMDLPDGRRVWEGDIFLIESAIAERWIAEKHCAVVRRRVPRFG